MSEQVKDHTQENVPSVTRRALVIGGASTAVLFGLGSLKYLGTAPLVRPPGGQDVESLLSKCIHCNRCGQACPENLLVPQRLDHGVLGTRTPYMVFSDNTPGNVDALKYCDFCEKANGGYPLCVAVCPSSALSLPADFSTEEYSVGFAYLDEDLCLAYRSGFCAFCHDACIEARGEEHAAIYYEGSVEDASRLPKVDADKCNGCGACESVCVSAQAGSTRNREERAITIKSLDVLDSFKEQGLI